MTTLGKGIITAGIFILTLGALAWIILQNWQWMAAGTAIFAGSLLSGAVLSAETKSSPKPSHNPPPPPPLSPSPRPPRLSHPPVSEWNSNPSQPSQPIRRPEETQTFPTVSIPKVKEWERPSTPPPDQQNDPFFTTKPRHQAPPPSETE